MAGTAAWLAFAGTGMHAVAAEILPPPRAVDAALLALGAHTKLGAVEAPEQVRLTLPKLIEDGAMVPVTVQSTLSGVRDVLVLADMNPAPIAAQFRIGPGVAARISVRIKLARSGRVFAAVRTADGLYWTAADAEVTVGGCS